MEKFIEYLEDAEKKPRMADHMTYVTFPLIKDKRLLLKILTEISSINLNCINAILQYEYIQKRINLTKDASTNLEIFVQQCASKYNISDIESKRIIEIINLAERHKKSAFEFVKEGKVVILSENLRTETITIEKIKEFLLITKSVMKKTRENILKKF